MMRGASMMHHSSDIGHELQPARAVGSELSTASPEGRDTGFRAVSGGPELASGPTLLVEAYAAIWILLLGFVVLTWRRMSRLESKLVELEHTIRPVGPETAGAALEVRSR
jgi:CcmD family protein